MSLSFSRLLHILRPETLVSTEQSVWQHASFIIRHSVWHDASTIATFASHTTLVTVTLSVWHATPDSLLASLRLFSRGHVLDSSIKTSAASFLWFRSSWRLWRAWFGIIVSYPICKWGIQSWLVESLNLAGWPDAKCSEHNRVNSFGIQCSRLIAAIHCDRRFEDNLLHFSPWLFTTAGIRWKEIPFSLPRRLWQPITQQQYTIALPYWPPRWRRSNRCYGHAPSIRRIYYVRDTCTLSIRKSLALV